MQSLEMRCEDLESNIAKVILSGRLDISGVQDIELKFTVYTSARRKPVIVDLSGVSLMTSMGLGMLITNAKTLQAQGIPFIILNPQPPVEKVLLMSGLQDLLPIEKNLASALDRIHNHS